MSGCHDSEGKNFNEWVSVGDRLPPDNANVLTYSKDGGMATVMFCYHNEKPLYLLIPSHESIVDENLLVYLKNVTHWMPLPSPPDIIK